MNRVAMRLTVQCLALAVALGWSSAARAQASVLYFWNPAQNANTTYASAGSLVILGLSAEADWNLADITTLPATAVTSGTIASYSTFSVPSSTFQQNHYYRLTADARINAFFGGDCCGYFGSFQVPSNEDASRRVGKSFTLWAPVMNNSTETWVFSREAGTVTVTGGKLPTGGVSFTFTGEQQGWKLPTCQNAASGSGDTLCNTTGVMDEKVFYNIASTGLISVEQSVNNGMATIPTASGWDVGPYGLFDIHANFDGAYAIFGYQDGVQFEVDQILPDAGHKLIADGGINFGEAFYMDGHVTPPGNLSPFHYLVTTNNGRISLWGGDTQNTFNGAGVSGAPGQCSAVKYVDGGLSPEADTLNCMGDDITFDVGDISATGSTIIVNTRSMGANVFAPFSETQVSVTGDITETVALPQDGTLYLAPWSQVTIVSSEPVLVQTTGGDHLDDWGKYLVQVPGSGTAPRAPIIDDPACSATPTFQLIGTAPALSQVTLFDELTVPVAGSPVTADDAGNWAFTVTIPSIADAGYSYFANDAVFGLPSAPTAPYTIVYLPNAPGAATLTAPVSGSILNTASPTVIGGATASDTVTLVVSLEVDGGSSVLHTYPGIKVATDGGFDFPLPDALPDNAPGSSYLIQVEDVNCAGTNSVAISATVTIDTTAPAAPVFVSPATSDTTYVSPTMLFGGTAEPNSVITLTLTDSSGGTFTTTVTTSSTGTWQFLGPTGLADGTITASATATDAAGNVSPAATTTVILNSTPAVETAPPTAATLNAANPTLSGTNPSGALVYVSVNGGPQQQATVTGSTWSLPTTLGAGTYTVTVYTQDAGGGSSGPTTATFTISTAPVVIVGPTAGQVLPPGQVTVSGTAAPNTTIALSVNGTTQTVTVDGSGNWTATIAAPTGSYSVTATDVDSVGNTGSSATTSFSTNPSATSTTNGSVGSSGSTGSAASTGSVATSGSSGSATGTSSSTSGSTASSSSTASTASGSTSSASGSSGSTGASITGGSTGSSAGSGSTGSTEGSGSTSSSSSASASNGGSGTNGSSSGMGSTIGGGTNGGNGTGGASTGSTHPSTTGSSTGTAASSSGSTTSEGSSGSGSGGTEATSGSTTGGPTSVDGGGVKARGCSSAGGGLDALWFIGPALLGLRRRSRRSA